MKILIVGFYTESYMPYISNYLECLDDLGIYYDVVYFDRSKNKKPERKEKQYIFHAVMTTNKLKKVIPYFRYIHYVKKIIRSNHYDKIIVLTTIPAVLLYRVLVNKYSENYLFDYRDYSYERIVPYKKMVDQIVQHSYATFVSSKGFMHYLSENNKIHFVHNISNIKSIVDEASKIDVDHIVIGFVGYVRYFDVNKALIDQLGNKTNFEIEYYGTMYDDCDLQTYISEKNVHNVFLFGEYNNADKPTIYQKITFINSIYSLRSKEVKYAIPNRLYDAAIYKKPIIASKHTFLGDVVEQYHLGFTIDIENDDFEKSINEYIKNYDTKDFTISCERFLADVSDEQKKYHQIIRDFISR